MNLRDVYFRECFWKIQREFEESLKMMTSFLGYYLNEITIVYIL